MTENKTVEWQVEGMSCHNCARNISKILQKEGMDEVDVNFATGKVSFVSPGSSGVLMRLKNGVQNLGFQVLSPGRGRNRGRKRKGLGC